MNLKRKKTALILLITVTVFSMFVYVYRCHCIVMANWSDFKEKPKQALGGSFEELDRKCELAYFFTLKPILKNPSGKNIRLYFEMVPDYCRGVDGYAYKDNDGIWNYKIP